MEISVTSLFGLDAATVQQLADKGLWGALALILIIVGKYWVIPSITKFLENRVTLSDKVVDKLDTLITTIKTSNERHDADIVAFKEETVRASQDRQNIDQKIDVLLGEHVGTLDDKLAFTTFANILHKQHLIALSFFNIRVQANGIHTQRDVIIGRYKRKAEELSNKTSYELQHYYHNRLPLSHFFPDNSSSYFNHLFNHLFIIQDGLIEKEEQITLEDLEAALDRNVSRLMKAFRKWLLDKNQTYDVVKETESFELFQEGSSFDEI
jgi:hypothetical protein